MRTLWMNPVRTPRKISLRRFSWYPFFNYTVFEQHKNLNVPDAVTVRWKPYKQFLHMIEVFDKEEIEKTEEWISNVVEMIRNYEDVPPLIMDGDEIFDGRHRAHAADILGIRLAPIVDISSYWKT